MVSLFYKLESVGLTYKPSGTNVSYNLDFVTFQSNSLWWRTVCACISSLSNWTTLFWCTKKQNKQKPTDHWQGVFISHRTHVLHFSSVILSIMLVNFLCHSWGDVGVLNTCQISNDFVLASWASENKWQKSQEKIRLGLPGFQKETNWKQDQFEKWHFQLQEKSHFMKLCKIV